MNQTYTNNQLFLAAAKLELLPTADPVVADACKVGAEILRSLASRSEPATWVFNGYTGTLRAADPDGALVLAFQHVPDFAQHVGSLLALPGLPIDVTPLPGHGAVTRGAIHAQRDRLAKRLDDRHQRQLASAVAEDITLEQDGRRVFAVYEPDGLPLPVADYP